MVAIIKKIDIAKEKLDRESTIRFTCRVHFRHVERSADKPEILEADFESFEEMLTWANKEKKRRKRGDRATMAEYRQVLTDYGSEALARDAADPDREGWWWEPTNRTGTYDDAIAGTWFNIF